MLVFTASGALLAGLSIPLILGKIPPNGAYGFRVKKTMENPEIWYPVNAYAGKWLLGIGLAIAFVAAVLAFIPNLGIDIYSYGVLAVLVVLFTLAILAVRRYMKSM
jgi:SdpI/YfhL protein family